MLMKQPDDRSPHLFELEQLKEAYPEHAGEIDPLILRLYLLDSQRMFADTVNLHLAEPLEDVVVLHDLRLPLGDEVLEIDHLLINRSLQITLVDSGFMGAESVRVNRLGEAFIWSPETEEWVGVRAAFQELFHKATQLERILDRERWPKRLGMRLAHPVEVCVVLADEDEVIIENPTRWEDRVMKITDFIRHYEKTKMKFTLTYGPLNVIQTGLNRVNKATMEKAAKLIADLHEFEPANYSERLGLELDLSESGMEPNRILKRHGLPDALDEFMPLDDLPRSLDEMAAKDEEPGAPGVEAEGVAGIEPEPARPAEDPHPEGGATQAPPAEETPAPARKGKGRSSRSRTGKGAGTKDAKTAKAKDTKGAKAATPRKKAAKAKTKSPAKDASLDESLKAQDATQAEPAPAKAPAEAVKAAPPQEPEAQDAKALEAKTPDQGIKPDAGPADKADEEAPVTNAPVTNAPVTNAPVTKAPVTKAPVTKAPVTKAPDAKAPDAKAPAADEHLPSSRIAASLKMKTPQFLEMMEGQGYLIRTVEGELEITEKGRSLGGQAKGKGGNRSFSWPRGVKDVLK